MALTLRYDTLPMTPVRNRAWFEVACDGYEDTAATVAVVRVQMLNQPSDGWTITLVLPGGESTTLTATAGFPDDTGTQFAIGADVFETYANLVAAMAVNPYLCELYMVETVTAETAELTAREPGANTPGISFSAPSIASTSVITDGADAVLAENYSANARIYLEKVWNSGVYTALPAVEQFPDEQGLASWDMASMLRAYFMGQYKGYDWPAYDQSNPSISKNIFRRYYIDRWERYGSPATDRKVIRSAIKYAWYAGTRNRDTDTANELGALLRYDLTATMWMTYRGRAGSKHEVSPAQQHVLGWYRSRDVVDSGGGTPYPLIMVTRVYYTDGTTADGVAVNDTAIDVEKGEVSIWPVGFETRGLHLLEPDKTPYKYEAWLIHQFPTPITEVHTFWLADAEESELHLEAVNSLGIVESFRTTGSWVESLDVEREDLATLRKLTDMVLPSIAESDVTSLLNGVNAPLQVSLGYVDRVEHFARMDILFSPELRIVDHATGRKLPVRLGSGSHVLRQVGADVDEHLYAMNLELVQGDPEMAWGDRSLLADFVPGAPGVPQPGE